MVEEFQRIRQILFYKNYFHDFFDQQKKVVLEKINYVLFVVTIAKRIPLKFFKHVENVTGLYEIRIEYHGNIYRIFCCFDEGQVVVVFHGFHKRSQKLPGKEIDKAKKIMTAYFDSKIKPTT
ncbi:MAG: type II toxin-antitoxin system RelE/ParE family toxin [Bacteroidia bacterium]|jgi:phage-related protein